ncbi:MAG: 50S ribosomal protein L11 methyltransferase [Desulfomonilaceae bacterium]
MISPDTLLYIYEIPKAEESHFVDTPASFIGLWNEDDFAYLFFTEPQDSYIQGCIEKNGLLMGGRHEVMYGDWQQLMPSDGLELGGVRFSHPDLGCAKSGALLLDPSVVFGSGLHPTSATCVEFICDLISSGDVEMALDLGSGTGILSLAAASLGVKKIVAVDKNRLAYKVTKENVRLNGLESRIQVFQGEARVYLDRPAEIVMANLPFSVLRDLVVMKDVELHKYWVVSGINREQADTLAGLFEDSGFTITRDKVTDPWVTFVAQKQ